MEDKIGLICKTFEMDELNQQISKECVCPIWASIGSVSRSEWRDAGVQGLKAEYVATTNAVNYNGEDTAIYNGVRYTIYRTYRDFNSDEIELYLAREVGA